MEWSKRLLGAPIKGFRVLTYTVSQKRQENLYNTTLKTVTKNGLPQGSRLFWFTNQQEIDPEIPNSILDPVFEIAHFEDYGRRNAILS